MSEPLIWFGSKPHPTLPQHNGYKTPTFTVGELVQELLKQPQDAPTGTAMSSILGHVSGIRRVTQDEHGCVILDQAEEQLYSDEVEIR